MGCEMWATDAEDIRAGSPEYVSEIKENGML